MFLIMLTLFKNRNSWFSLAYWKRICGFNRLRIQTVNKHPRLFLMKLFDPLRRERFGEYWENMQHDLGGNLFLGYDVSGIWGYDVSGQKIIRMKFPWRSAPSLPRSLLCLTLSTTSCAHKYWGCRKMDIQFKKLKL